MVKRVLSMCCSLLLIMGLLALSVADTQAAANEPVIDGSYLTHEDESIGYDTKVTRGEDLMTGYSKAVRLGPGILYAGGSTIASHTVEEVGVGVIVERAQEGDDHWSVYDSWQKFNENADRVSSNKRMEVEGGYYYRVRSTHSANDDVSSSFTDGVFIENP